MSMSRSFLLVLTFALMLALACSSESPSNKATILGGDQLAPNDGPDQGEDIPGEDPDGDHGSFGTPGLRWHFVIDPAGEGVYTGADILPTDDYGCLVLGAKHDGDERNQDIVVYKFDSGGKLEWTSAFAGSSGLDDYPYSLLQTQDGNYAFAALMSEGFHQACICKLDSKGNELWRSPLGHCFFNSTDVLTEAPNGDLVLVGRYPSITADPKIFVTDSEGHLKWTRSFPEDGLQDFRGVVPSADGGFVLAKVSNHFDDYSSDMLMTKVDASGAVVWERSFSQPGGEIAMSLVRTEKAYIMGGWIPGGGGSSIGLKAVDENGLVRWEATDNSSLRTYCLDLALAANGDLLVVGKKYQNKVMVSRFTGSGSLLWQKTYVQGQLGYGFAIKEAADGGILIVFDVGPQMHVMKLGANGEAE